MIARIISTLFVSTFLLLDCYSQNFDIDDDLRNRVALYGQADVTIRNSADIDLNELSLNLSVFAVRNKLVYISLSPLTVEWFISRRIDYQIIDNKGGKGIITAIDIEQAKGWDTYPTYSQYIAIIQSFIGSFPELCHLDTIGTSINGKLILALKISDNADTDEDEPEVLYTSTIHGDELAGFVLMLRLADYLLNNYESDTRVKTMVDNLEIWINPLSNPDGTYPTSDEIISPKRYNANSYDLNRNFPDPEKPYSSTNVMQKETVDMVRFLRKHRFVISANFHSGAEVVNYPWDKWRYILHADDLWFYNISRAYADTVHIYSGPDYMSDLDNGVTRGALWYSINGGRQDFVTWELQGREVTIELDSTKITPSEQLGLLWQYNWRSFLGYLENAMYGIHGQVIDAISKEPVQAKLFIGGYDKDSSHVYSDTLTGKLVRLLGNGDWNLTFSAEGYISDTISNVHVLERTCTVLPVEMTPVKKEVDSTNTESPLLYPNPAINELYAVLPQIIAGSLRVTIVSQTGSIISEYTAEAEQGIPLVIDLKGLAAGVYFIKFWNTTSKSFYYSRFIVIK